MARDDLVLPASIAATALRLAELDPDSPDDVRETIACLRTAVDELPPTTSGAAATLSDVCDRLEGIAVGDLDALIPLIREVAVALDQLMDDLALGADDAAAPSPPVDERADDAAHTAMLVPDGVEPELLEEFVAESRELLEQCEDALLELEGAPDDTESINTVFRGFHTIKGTAACLGFGAISGFAHRAESLLSRVRDGELYFADHVAELALQSRDMLAQMTEAMACASGSDPAELPDGLEALERKLERPDASSVGASGSRYRAAERTARPSRPADDEAAAPDATSRPRAGSGGAGSVRVRTDRLDALIDMVGELVVAQSMVSERAGTLSNEQQELLQRLHHVTKIVRELHDLGLAMRMVPLRGVYRRLQRVVRDVTQRSGKSVRFVTEGETTEIDRNMVDLITDPLIHMVRNAVDHGIEAADARTAADKPSEGTLRLSATHAGGTVQIRLEDDGRGLDRDAIRARAVKRGLVQADAELTDSEIHELLFKPGFSTAETVTDISGRGVGLDVVRRAIEQLQGRIEISSTPGHGTTFAIRLPLTLAIADGMQVRCGDQRFIVPTVNIQMSLRPDRALPTVQGRGELLPLRDEMLPVFRLGRLFDIESAVSDPQQGLLVVLDDGDQRFALLVDELLSQQQVVVKPLNAVVGKVAGVSGAAVLGDGSVGLILDPGELASLGRMTSIAG